MLQRGNFVLFVFIVPVHWSSGYSVRQWPWRPGSVPGRVIPRTQKMKFDASLLYTQYWFGWARFYGISTLVGYFIPNPVYTYIFNIYDLETDQR